MNRSQRAALVVIVVVATVAGQAVARAWRVQPLIGRGAPNVVVLADPTKWHGAVTPSALPSLPGHGPVPTLPRRPPPSVPLLHGTTTTAPTTTTAAPTTTTAPANPVVGFGAADLQSAYGLDTAAGGQGQTIAVIEASGDPSANDDLAVYRSHFGLPACSTQTGCLRIVNQDGGSSQPPVNESWALETATDLDMASAMCPACNLLVVQANSETLADFAAANVRAARLGATVINNSWGWAEGSDTTDDSAYVHDGVVTVAASGEGGYTTDSDHPEGVIEFPASSPNVVAVGGTSLTRDAAAGPRGWSESAWSGTGSGCSVSYAKPAWQSAPCAVGRAITDVAAVADPATGVAVYDSVGANGRTGWMTVGGTSVSSAIVSGVYGLAGNAGSLAVGAGERLYGQTANLNDVTSGSTGSCSDAPARCTAAAGWDGPTGNGTPRGTSAF